MPAIGSLSYYEQPLQSPLCLSDINADENGLHPPDAGAIGNETNDCSPLPASPKGGGERNVSSPLRGD